MPQLKKTVKFSLWLQWTLTRVKIHLSANDCLSGFKRRIIFEVEDIMTSLDLQNVYAKLKTKVRITFIFIFGGVYLYLIFLKFILGLIYQWSAC